MLAYCEYGRSHLAGPLVACAVLAELPDHQLLVAHAQEPSPCVAMVLESLSVAYLNRHDLVSACAVLQSRALKSLATQAQARGVDVHRAGVVTRLIHNLDLSLSWRWRVPQIRSRHAQPTAFTTTVYHRALMLARENYRRRMARAVHDFPGWNFGEHWGADTPEHRQTILARKTGTACHRVAFHPLCRFAHTMPHPSSSSTALRRGSARVLSLRARR